MQKFYLLISHASDTLSLHDEYLILAHGDIKCLTLSKDEKSFLII